MLAPGTCYSTKERVDRAVAGQDLAPRAASKWSLSGGRGRKMAMAERLQKETRGGAAVYVAGGGSGSAVREAKGCVYG